MEVVAHLAVGQHLCVEPLHRLGVDVQLGRPVNVVPTDRLATITSCSDVVDRAAELDSKGTRPAGERGGDFGKRQDLTPCFLTPCFRPCFRLHRFGQLPDDYFLDRARLGFLIDAFFLEEAVKARPVMLLAHGYCTAETEICPAPEAACLGRIMISTS